MSAIKNGAYSLVGQLFQLLINFVGLIILVCLLTPEIFVVAHVGFQGRDMVRV